MPCTSLLTQQLHPPVVPQATLESSLEALNVKKFDLAFAVDPLFHKTSAQFDEGGAKGAQPGGRAAGRHSLMRDWLYARQAG